MSYLEIITDEEAEKLNESAQIEEQKGQIEEKEEIEEKEVIELDEDATVFEAEESDNEETGKGKTLAETFLIWILQQCLMSAFQLEFAAAPGQETFSIKDTKVQEKFNHLAKILDAIDEKDLSSVQPLIDGKSSGSAKDNAKYAQDLIKACPKEHGDEIKEILQELKEYFGNQVAAFKLN